MNISTWYFWLSKFNIFYSIIKMPWGAGTWVYDYNKGWVWKPGSSRQRKSQQSRKQVHRKHQTRKQSRK